MPMVPILLNLVGNGRVDDLSILQGDPGFFEAMRRLRRSSGISTLGLVPNRCPSTTPGGFTGAMLRVYNH